MNSVHFSYVFQRLQFNRISHTWNRIICRIIQYAWAHASACASCSCMVTILLCCLYHSIPMLFPSLLLVPLYYVIAIYMQGNLICTYIHSLNVCVCLSPIVCRCMYRHLWINFYAKNSPCCMRVYNVHSK